MQSSQPQTRKNKQKNKKTDLLKFQKPVYQIKRNQQGKVENIIAKLMQNKQKPQISALPRSPIFDQLNHFIPLIKKSNNELLSNQIKPQKFFDAKLQQVQDSSESSQSEGQQMENQDIVNQKMIEQNQQPQYLQSCEQFQINILKYPYLASQQQTIEVKESIDQKGNKIVQLQSTQEIKQQKNYLETLQ